MLRAVREELAAKKVPVPATLEKAGVNLSISSSSPSNRTLDEATHNLV
jgi:hypothetical protein